jgi:hypothetical protein
MNSGSSYLAKIYPKITTNNNVIMTSVFRALLAVSNVSSLFPAGNFFEKWNYAAANKNKPPTAIYKVIIESNESAF